MLSWGKLWTKDTKRKKQAKKKHLTATSEDPRPKAEYCKYDPGTQYRQRSRQAT